MDKKQTRSNQQCTEPPPKPSKKRSKLKNSSVEIVKHFEPKSQPLHHFGNTDLPYVVHNVIEPDHLEIVPTPIKFRTATLPPKPYNHKRTLQKKKALNKYLTTSTKTVVRSPSFSSSTSQESKPPRRFPKKAPVVKTLTDSNDKSIKIIKHVKPKKFDETFNRSKKADNACKTSKTYSVVTASYIQNLKDEIHSFSKDPTVINKAAKELRAEIDEFRNATSTNVRVSFKKHMQTDPEYVQVQIDNPLFKTACTKKNKTDVCTSPLAKNVACKGCSTSTNKHTFFPVKNACECKAEYMSTNKCYRDEDRNKTTRTESPFLMNLCGSGTKGNDTNYLEMQPTKLFDADAKTVDVLYKINSDHFASNSSNYGAPSSSDGSVYNTTPKLSKTGEGVIQIGKWYLKKKKRKMN